MAKKTTPTKKAAAKKVKTKTVSKKPANKKPVLKKAIKKVIVKKAAAKKVVTKKAVVKKTATKKPIAKKTVAKKTTAKKQVAKKIDAKKTAIKKQNIKKAIKPAAKKIVPKKTIKKVAVKPKPVSKKKIIQKKVIKTQPKKKAVAVKKVPAKKPDVKITNKKAILPKPKAVVKKEIPKAKIKEVKTASVVTEKPTLVKKARPIPIKLPTITESNYSRADMFYKNVLRADIIKRYSPKKNEDKDMLSKDISLHVKMNDKESTISEKTRDQDWNDIYVEIYRKYPDEAGWIKFTEAEFLAYFFPGRVFFSKMEPIRNLCQDILCRAVNTGIFKDMYYMFFRSSGRHSQSIKINNKTYSFTFHQTYHEAGENSFYSIGLILPFVMLMDFRIDYKIFKQ